MASWNMDDGWMMDDGWHWLQGFQPDMALKSTRPLLPLPPGPAGVKFTSSAGFVPSTSGIRIAVIHLISVDYELFVTLQSMIIDDYRQYIQWSQYAIFNIIQPYSTILRGISLIWHVLSLNAAQATDRNRPHLLDTCQVCFRDGRVANLLRRPRTQKALFGPNKSSKHM